MLEADESLRDAIFTDLEVVFLQVRNQPVALKNGGIEDDLFHISVKNVPLAFLFEGPSRSGGRLVIG